jgi:hypothetical protein
LQIAGAGNDGETSRALVRAAAVAGVVGPALFAAVLVALTVMQYEFMVGIGWRPLRDPAGAWPSGLALGPHGWAMTAGFVASGLLLMLFAVGVQFGAAGGRGSPAGPAFLFVAGSAMSLMGFETDPIRRTGPRTLHGWVHDLAFVLFAFALLLALLFLWRRLRRDAPWRGHAIYTLFTGALAVLLLFLPGAAFYAFLVVVLAWFEVTALRLWRTCVPSSPRR